MEEARVTQRQDMQGARLSARAYTRENGDNHADVAGVRPASMAEDAPVAGQQPIRMSPTAVRLQDA